MRDRIEKKTYVCFSKLQGHVSTLSRGFESNLACQHFISDWLGKLKPNKLSSGCQNELRGAAVAKATNPGRRFLFFLRLRRSVVPPTKPPCYAGQPHLGMQFFIELLLSVELPS